MHKRYLTVVVAAIVVTMSSCIKQIEKTFTGQPVVEFDAAVLNPVTPPYNYPVLLRIPPYGLPSVTANSPIVITRTMTDTVKLRVNLVGAHRNQDEVISYRVLTDVTPASPNLLAVAGTHFTTGTSFTIPARSSFGEVFIIVRNPGTSSTNPREVHLELMGNSNIKPSENYKRIAIRIAQN